jgi:protocatechuate 3,4-dioxygenase beta subunit
MERSAFIKKLTLAGASLSLLQSCSSVKKCIKTSSDEEGPFPTKEPVLLTTQNIVADRAGIPFAIKIIINNINDNCKAMKDAIVDIWHCDYKGEYSEYGGGKMSPPRGNHGKDFSALPTPDKKDSMTGHDEHRRSPMNGGGMQATDYTGKHFLRGRQITNAEGIVSFNSIFPGWYPGRAPHIHAHIFDKTGKSLLITQIALPEEISQQVYAEGVYKDHGQPDTSNANDHIFRDSIANELASITGNTADGYILTHSIYVKA